MEDNGKIAEDYNLLLIKNGIDTEKWYHKLLTDQYFDREGNLLFNDDEKIKKMKLDYQKSIKLKNISILNLIRNELLGYKQDQDILKLFIDGNICNINRIPINCENKSIENLINYCNNLSF